MEIREKHTSTFGTDVDNGLSSTPKKLPSKYFYNKKGDSIFQQIMNMPEYYLTNCEYEIFEKQKDSILSHINPKQKFNLVELGAGDGYKTKVLLQYFLDKNVDFEYFPVDISSSVLDQLENDLKNTWPSLKAKSLNFEYFKALEHLNNLDNSPKVILFLGSNIGNFTPQHLNDFFNKLYSIMRSGDKLLCGVDLKKNPNTILRAYSDSMGITSAFNLNLLDRINKELDANFNTNYFKHYANYDPITGEAKSYLISTQKQEVFIGALNKKYSFDIAEPIHTEISKKYALSEVEQLAEKSKFVVEKHFIDSKSYFTDSLWIKP